jgi:hypothetical protein
MDGPLYKWDGTYCGFVRNGYLFDANSEYKGWIEEGGDAWDSHGRFIGELVDENYILRRSTQAQPANRVARVQPVSPVTPVGRVNRVGRVGRAGSDDALEDW